MANKTPQGPPGSQKWPAWKTTVVTLITTDLLKRLIDWAVEQVKQWW